MNDATNLFLTADTHWAARAARGRVDAINAHPDLHWLVVITCEGVDRQFSYDHAPSFAQIVRDTRASGLCGEVLVRSITVGRKRQRRLILMPWQRVKALGTTPLPIAAE